MFDNICAGILIACGIDTLIVLNQPNCDKTQTAIRFFIACVNFVWAISILRS